jgi:hypothetical protein
VTLQTSGSGGHVAEGGFDLRAVDFFPAGDSDGPGRTYLEELEHEERLLRDVEAATHRTRSPRHHTGVGALMRALRAAREAGVPEIRIRVATARGRERGHQDEIEDLVAAARREELAGYPESWL